MAETTIEAAVQGTLGANQWSDGRMQAWPTASNGYVFFTSVVSSFRDAIYYRKSTDGGANWGARVTVIDELTNSTNAIHFTIYANWWSGFTDGIVNVVANIPISGTQQIRFITLDTDDDSLGTPVNILAGAAFTADQTGMSMCKAFGGNLYVAVHTGSGTGAFYRSTNGGTSWASRTTVFDAATLSDMVLLAPGDNTDTQDIICFYWDTSATTIIRRRYDDSANSWSSTNISTGMTRATRGNASNSMACCTILDGGANHGQSYFFAWNAYDTATADLKCWLVGWNVITAKTDVITNTSEAVCVCASVDRNTGDVYCGYIAGGTYQASSNVWYKKSTNAAVSWGSAVQLNTVADDMRIVASDQGGLTSTRFSPCWYNDDLADILINTVGVEISSGSPVTESLATATASADSLAITAAIKAQMNNSLATASLLQATGSLIALMELKTATAEHFTLEASERVTEELAIATADAIALESIVSIVGSMATTTANAELLALVTNYKETLALMTASAEHLSITAFIKASMAIATASAEHLSLEALSDLTEEMATAIASAEHLSITSKINALMALSTAAAEYLELVASIGIETDIATADAVMLDITAAINAVLEIATADTEHLPLTDEVLAEANNMGKMTADAVHLEITAAINSLMSVGTADAVHLALTMAAVLLMEKQTATAEQLELLVGLSQNMNIQTASAIHMPITAAFQALMGIGAAEAIMLSLIESQNDVVNQMALSTASAELLVLIASINSSMGLSSADAEHLVLLGSIKSLMGLGTADAVLLPLIDDIEALVSMGLSTADALHLVITVAIDAQMNKQLANAELLIAQGSIDSLLDIALATSIHLPIEIVLVNALPGTMTASGIFLPSIGSIIALLDTGTAAAELLQLTESHFEPSQFMDVMTATAVMKALIIDILIGAILDGCVDLDELIDKNTWINRIRSSGFVEELEEIISSGYVKAIVQSETSGYIKDPNKTNPWDL